MTEHGRNSAHLRTGALLIFGIGLLLLIRLVVVALPEEPAPTPPVLANPTLVATIEQVRAPLVNSPVPGDPSATPTPPAEPTRAVEPSPQPMTTAVVPLEPTANDATASPEPTAGATLTTAPTTATSTVATPSPTASATSPPTPSGPTPTVAGRLVNNRIEPPWWPCEPNAIKAESKLGYYYPPDHPRYSAVYVGVTCFPSVAAAQAAGYVEAP